MFNERVFNACCNLLIDLKCHEFKDSPYFAPFVSYVLKWPWCMPLRTIIIGQNPYPQPIYPVHGAALSYDDALSRGVPPSVSVIAEDLFNFDGTDKSKTVSCIRDLWAMAENGIIAINESVFAKIMDRTRSSNLLPGRESEYQVRALQVMISESIIAGQESIDCIGMGISAAMMASVLRGWAPNDLVRFRVHTCSNPAALARQLGDTKSHPVTFAKSSISKILSGIVKEYTDMPPREIQNRKAQNIAALKQCSESVSSSTASVRGEYANFMERLNKRNQTTSSNGTASMEDIGEAMGRFVRAADVLAGNITAYTIAFDMASKSASASTLQSSQGSYGQSQARNPLSPMVSQSPSVDALPRPRRVRLPSVQASSAQSIKEEAVDAGPETKSQGQVPQVDSKPLPMQLGTLPRPRRIASSRMSQSNASSVAGTEYTVDDTSGPKVGSTVAMSRSEAVHIRSIADWISKNVQDGDTYSELLRSMIDTKVASSKLCVDVCDYVKSRVEANPSYDAWTECKDMSSDTAKWIASTVRQ